MATVHGFNNTQLAEAQSKNNKHNSNNKRNNFNNSKA